MAGRAKSLRTNMKSHLMRYPWAYRLIQQLRDRRYLWQSREAGTYSQHGEDRVILELLDAAGAKGPYADIGSNHPFVYNNTFLLYTRGWRGVCVDPLPRFVPLYRRWRPDDLFVCAAVGAEEGETPLFEFEWDMLSTLSQRLAQAYETAGHRLFRVTGVQTRPIDAILANAGLTPPLSLLSLDVEGYELSAVQTIDLDHWQPQLVCLEVQTADGTVQSDATAHLERHGYRIARDLGLNVILERG